MKETKHKPAIQTSPRNTRLVGRRKLMKVLATGGGIATGAALVPARWTSPIVESIGLPAHAQLSGTVLSDLLTNIEADAGRPSDGTRLADLLVPPAHAVPVTPTPEPGTAEAIENGCIILIFNGEFVEVLLQGPFFSGSGGGSGTPPFDVFVGSYVVGILSLNDFQIPTQAGGNVICNNGIYNWSADVNGPCGPGTIPTKTPP